MKQMDTLSQILLNSLPIPIRLIEMNNSGLPVYRFYNQFACAATGVTPEQVLGKSAAEVFPDEGGCEATQKHREVCLTREPLTYVHYLHLAAGLRTLQTTLVPLPCSEDSDLLIIGTTKDLTAQLTSEAAWLKAETSHQEILRFTELAAHDLRTPMRQVTAMVDILREDFQDLGDGKADVLDKIQAVSARTMSLITNLLTRSAGFLASGEVEEFYLGALSADLFIMLDPLRHHNLTKDTATITADKTAVQIVLRNLIDNALKHNQPKAIDVHISVAQSKQSNMLDFTVADNGKGFTDPDTVFDERKDAQKSGGFGLPAIRRLVVSRGGEISSQSHPEKPGATIVFSLPGELNCSDSIVDSKIAV